MAVVQHRCRPDPARGAERERPVCPRGQPFVELPRRQCRCRRVHQAGYSVVVLLGQRAGRVCPAGESSGDTLSNTTDELQRQSHLSAHPTRQARGVRAGGSKPPAHPGRSLWASRRRSQRLDGHQRISRLDDQPSRLGLGMEGRMELGRARQPAVRGSRWSVRRRPLGDAEWHGGPIRRHRDTRRAGWQSRLATRSPPQPGGRIAQLLQGRLVREPSREGRRRSSPD